MTANEQALLACTSTLTLVSAFRWRIFHSILVSNINADSFQYLAFFLSSSHIELLCYFYLDFRSM